MNDFFGSAPPLVPPLVTSAVFRVRDLDHLDQIIGGETPGYIYARDGHPNAKLLADDLSKRHRAEWTLICSSGMAAISLAILGCVSSGERIVASNRLYGRTNKLLREEMKRFNVEVDFVDVNDLNRVESALRKPTKLLIVETISNPTLRVAPLIELVAICKKGAVKLLVDNTFASPVLCRPLELGADLVMESLTKMIGGHSDVTLGSLSGSDSKGLKQFQPIHTTWGFASNPFDCWLTCRGLETLDLRMNQASLNATALASWMRNRKSVLRVLHPSLVNHPDHDLAKSLLPLGTGNMLSFEIAGGRDGVNHFMRSSVGIPFCPSLGHTTTTCSYPAGTSHRYDSAEEKATQGITEGLIRLSVGTESIDQIKIHFGEPGALATGE